MTNKKSKLALAVLLAIAGGAAHAQSIRPAYSYPGPAPKEGAASVQLGDSPVYFTPWIGFGAGYDSNVLLTENNETSSPLYIVSPGFKLDARSANSVFQVYEQLQVGRYTDSEDDSYTDNLTRLQYDTAFSARSFLRLGVDYARGHDARGSTDRPNSATPDKFNLWSPNVTYAYGARGAQGRLELYASDTHKKYINNREFTQFSDRDTLEYGGAYYWRVAPRTYAMAELRQTDISYRVSNSPFSGEEQRYFVGVQWEATAATSGTLKFGQLRRKFDSGVPTEDSTSWEGLITWAPRTYSTFDFYTARGTNESTGLGNYILSDYYGVNWTHAWNSVVSTGVNARYQRDKYQGFPRTDDTKTLNLRVGYKFRRWLTLGAEYTYTDRSSNIPNVEYDKNLYMLTATASM